MIRVTVPRDEKRGRKGKKARIVLWFTQKKVRDTRDAGKRRHQGRRKGGDQRNEKGGRKRERKEREMSCGGRKRAGKEEV